MKLVREVKGPMGVDSGSSTESEIEDENQKVSTQSNFDYVLQEQGDETCVLKEVDDEDKELEIMNMQMYMTTRTQKMKNKRSKDWSG
jgi:hypothetical protein